MLSAVLSFLGGPVASIIDKAVPDRELATRLKHELQVAAISQESALAKSAGEIIAAEARSDHPLAAQWRPILMLSITAILLNNYLFAPYAQAIFGASVTLELPDPLWTLLTVGVGGYVMGRSAEKAVRNWKN
ncbi:MAG: 3TM-type holin [Alphaproteobacteria bacterium]|uniref:3TM-type holin n=1 Tax=Pyruvatibacter sp. HU-CL02332 TaxID=3127650 RepID=UPI002968D0A0|nr:3TM-type holin [Alphaproteobacteria bacterium]